VYSNISDCKDAKHEFYLMHEKTLRVENRNGCERLCRNIAKARKKSSRERTTLVRAGATKLRDVEPRRECITSLSIKRRRMNLLIKGQSSRKNQSMLHTVQDRRGFGWVLTANVRRQQMNQCQRGGNRSHPLQELWETWGWQGSRFVSTRKGWYNSADNDNQRLSKRGRGLQFRGLKGSTYLRENKQKQRRREVLIIRKDRALVRGTWKGRGEGANLCLNGDGCPEDHGRERTNAGAKGQSSGYQNQKRVKRGS